jgi:uncharacterized damage-inducible protein DinB
MTLTEVLKQEAQAMYAVTEKLFGLVQPSDLGWKPTTGSNWMTVAQVMHHCTNACGVCVKGFVTGDWGLPPGASFEDMPAEAMMPPAEKLPAVQSVEEAKRLLAEDREIAMRFLAETGEENLLSRKMAAPWGGPETTLFQHLDHMIGHLGQHKGQLFYYLKLMGKNVNTMTLWGD